MILLPGNFQKASQYFPTHCRKEIHSTPKFSRFQRRLPLTKYPALLWQTREQAFPPQIHPVPDSHLCLDHLSQRQASSPSGKITADNSNTHLLLFFHRLCCRWYLSSVMKSYVQRLCQPLSVYLRCLFLSSPDRFFSLVIFILFSVPYRWLPVMLPFRPLPVLIDSYDPDSCTCVLWS